MDKKYVLTTVVIMAVLVVFAAASAILLGEFNKQNRLIFTLFNSELQQATNDFYSEYLSDNPCLANYSGKVLSVKKNDHGYYIKFAIQPYTGPHWPVGDDELEYFVDNIGDVTLLRFSHKKNYDWPEWLGVKVKKPIPLS